VNITHAHVRSFSSFRPPLTELCPFSETTCSNDRPPYWPWDTCTSNDTSYVTTWLHAFPSLPFSAPEFVVQGHRYDIWEDVGCYPTTVNTPPAYPLSFVWGPVIGLISVVYCSTSLPPFFWIFSLIFHLVLTLREFMKRRAQFSQFISSNTSLTVNRYFRLMCLATTELVFNLPITLYGLYLNITSRPIYPWKSWSDTHFDFFTIDTFPAFLWRSNPVEAVNLELSRWSLILCAFLFFGFFGFADESRKHYRIAYWAVAKRFGVVPPPSSDKFPAK